MQPAIPKFHAAGLYSDMQTTDGADVGEVVELDRSDRAAALADLYAAYAPEAIRLAYLLTGDRFLAEDLVQDAFVRVTGRFQHLRDPRSFEGYLRRTVVNLLRNHWRRRGVERKYLARERSSKSLEWTSPPNTEEQDALWTALQQLPHRQRAAVTLRYYEDMSEQQVSDVLGCSAQAAKSLVARGMESLRAQMETRNDE